MSRPPAVAPRIGSRARKTFVVVGTLVVAAMSGCGLLTDVGDYKNGSLPTESVPDVETVDPPLPDDSGGAGSEDADGATEEPTDASGDANDSGPPPPNGKKVFVTSDTRAGVFGGLANADTQCKAVADAAGLGADKKWVAWLSTSGTSAVIRLKPVGPWFLLTGPKVADSPAELSSGKIRHAIDVTELGAPLGDADGVVWTGTGTNGTSSGTPCNNWTLNFFNTGVAGSAKSADGKWTSATNHGCGSSARFYCFEQ